MTDNMKPRKIWWYFTPLIVAISIFAEIPYFSALIAYTYTILSFLAIIALSFIITNIRFGKVPFGDKIDLDNMHESTIGNATVSAISNSFLMIALFVNEYTFLAGIVTVALFSSISRIIAHLAIKARKATDDKQVS